MGVSLLPISVDLHDDLLYIEPPANWLTEIGWFDRSGARRGMLADPGPWNGGRISPDGRHMIAPLTDAKSNTRRTDLWLIDLSTGERSRLTFDEGDASFPAWSPNGERVAWMHTDEHGKQLRVRALAGGAATTLLDLATLDEPALDWSPDGSNLAYTVFEASNGHFEIHDLDMQTHKTQRLVGIDSRRPRFSPDGKLLAYTCTESGPEEVYVLRLADGRKWQISNSGGSLPRWTKAGEELFFLGADQRLRTVAAHLGSEPTFGTPILPPNAQRFFVSPYFFYEVTPDGERIFADAPSPTVLNLKLRIIVNWPALLK